MLIISAALLIAIGWLIDKNGTSMEELFWNNEGLWFTFFSSFLIVSGLSVKLYNKDHSQGSRLSKIYFIIIICILIFNSISIGFSFKYTLELAGSSPSEPAVDVIDIAEADIYAEEIDLSALEQIAHESKKATLVYIGRADCYECSKFEKMLDSYLKKEKINCKVYYTDRDRNIDREEEMYELLGEMQIDSVPAVVIFKDNSIKKLWLDPVKEIKDIEASGILFVK